MGELLGKVVLECTQEQEITDARQKEKGLADVFPELGLEDDEVEEETEYEDTISYLWDINEDSYNIYVILRNFLSEHYAIDSTLLLRLIDEKKLALEQTLFNIPYIHSGYVATILPKESTSNGK